MLSLTRNGPSFVQKRHAPVERDSLPFFVAIAVKGGQGHRYLESPPVALSDGWNRGVTFDFTRSNWKSARSGWEFTETLGKAPLHLLTLVIYGPPERIEVDNITWVGGDTEVPDTKLDRGTN